MARKPPSEADQALLAALDMNGWPITYSQLKRWRAQGFIPQNPRHYFGRGRGSRSELHPEAIEAAQAVAMIAKRGRPIPPEMAKWRTSTHSSKHAATESGTTEPRATTASATDAEKQTE